MVPVSGIGVAIVCIFFQELLKKVQLLKGKSNFVKRCLMLSTVVFQSDTGRGLGTTSLPLTVVLSKCPEKNCKDKDKDRNTKTDTKTETEKALKRSVDNQSPSDCCTFKMP